MNTSTLPVLRFWFRNSELYNQGPYTMLGVLATSWDEAKATICGPEALPEAKKLMCIGPQYYFLSCNVVDMQALPDEDDGVPVTVRTHGLTKNFRDNYTLISDLPICG